MTYFPLEPLQKLRCRDAVQLGVVELEGHRQGGPQPLFPVLAPDEKGVVVAPLSLIHIYHAARMQNYSIGDQGVSGVPGEVSCGPQVGTLSLLSEGRYLFAQAYR